MLAIFKCITQIEEGSQKDTPSVSLFLILIISFAIRLKSESAIIN